MVRHCFNWKRVSAAADTVCANAEAVRCLCLLEEGCRPEQVVVVRNGIDLERFDRLAALAPEGPLPEGDPLVAVIANLWPVKGHAVLLEAAARVRAQLPGARFALVGDGPERPALVRRAEALGLGDAVRFLGTRYDVPALLSRAHALCHPSHAEGLPNALMEGMAARLPAVATAVGGIPELIEDGLTGYLVRPCDPAALADRLVALLADRDQARAMGLRARAKAERELSIVRMREGYRSLYCRLLDASPAPTPAVA